MFGIKLENGNFLKLDPKAKIPMSLSSPLIYEEEGSYSYTFNIPIEGNAELLGFPNALMKAVINTTFNVDLYLYNNPWSKASLKIKNIKKQQYICYVKLNESYYASQVANKTLNTLEMGGLRNIKPYNYVKLWADRWEPNSTKNLIIATSNNPAGKVLTIGAPESPYITASAYYTTSVDVETTLTQIAINLKADPNFYNYGFLDTSVVTYLTSAGIVAHYLLIVMQTSSVEIVPEEGSRWMTQDPWGIEYVSDHMLEVSQQSYPDVDYAFFPVKNEGLYEAGKYFFEGFVNYFDYGVFPPVYQFITTPLRRTHPIIPFPYLLYVFKRCFSEYGYNIKTTEVWEEQELSKLCIYNNYAVPFVLARIDGTVIKNENDKFLNLQNHVPDLTIGEFINFVQRTFNLSITISNNTVQVDFKNNVLDSNDYEDWTEFASPWEEILFDENIPYKLSPEQDPTDSYVSERTNNLSEGNIKDPVQSIGDLPTVGLEDKDLRLVLDLNYYYICNRLISPTDVVTFEWVFYSENIVEYTPNSNSSDTSSIIASTATEIIEDLASGYTGYDQEWLIPKVNQLSSNKEGGERAALRLLFYRGMQPGRNPDGTAMEYPLGTPYNKNFNFETIGDLTMSPEDIHNKYHKKWLEFKSKTRSVKFKLRLPKQKIMEPKYNLKKRINGVNYFLANIDLDITTNGHGEAIGEFFKIT